jgi:thioredoxin-like negative regulator of GroEL
MDLSEPQARLVLIVFLRRFADILLRHAAPAQASRRFTEDHLRNAIALDPSNDAARLDMVAILVDRGELAAARTQWGQLSPKAAQASAHATTAARLEAAERAATLPAAADLEARIAADPGDLAARLDLAEVRIAGHEVGAAARAASRDREARPRVRRRHRRRKMLANASTWRRGELVSASGAASATLCVPPPRRPAPVSCLPWPADPFA